MSAMTSGQVPFASARRFAVLFAAAAVAFVMMRGVADEHDWSGLAQARDAYRAATSKQARAERLLASEAAVPEPVHDAVPGPAMVAQQRLAHGDSTQPPDRAEAVADRERDPLWLLAQAAHEQGLHLRRLAPAPAGGPGAPSVANAASSVGATQYDVDGAGRFAAIGAWVQVLAGLPLTVAPVRFDVERKGAGASFSARFEIWPEPATMRDGLSAWPDPLDAPMVGLPGEPDFGGRDATVRPRLVGIVGNARRRLAVFDAEAGKAPWCAVAGERIGGERVARVDIDGVWFGAGDGREYRVSLAGEEEPS